MPQRATQRESLRDQVQDLHEEARMVLPGVQALFGFQLIAAFNTRFTELEFPDTLLHLVALLLIAASMGLLMAPAAYRRLCEPSVASAEFTRLGSVMIATALIPLSIGVSIDIYVVARMTFARTALLPPVLTGAATFVVLAFLWFVFPLWKRRHNRSRAKVHGALPIGTRTAELRRDRPPS